MTDHPAAARVTAIYEAVASSWDARRAQTLFERPWLDAFRAAMPGPAPSVLDLGCGTGRPLGACLADGGWRITGIDAAPAMIAAARAALPAHDWHVADMRALPPLGPYDGLLAWHSLFHLSPDDQRAAIAGFATLAKPGAPLLFTSGPEAGEVIGTMNGEPLYHASLDPDEYRAVLAAAGFDVLRHVPEDPESGGATVWLARRRPAA
jgi:SAM-dependent methyltransferase